MRVLKIFRNLKWAHLSWLYLFGLCLALTIGLLVSSFLTSRWKAQVRKENLNLFVSSIEAGPLTLARLNSSRFAQEQLDRMLSQGSESLGGINSVSILGGEAFEFAYAKWTSAVQPGPNCSEVFERKYAFTDSVYPFQVTIVQNRCSPVASIARSKLITLYGLLAVVIFVAAVSFLAVLPVIQSLFRVTHVIRDSNSKLNDLESVAFLPIRALGEGSILARQFEREAAFVEVARSVAHDIRSPLMALSVVTRQLENEGSQSAEIARLAMEQIRTIANDLLDKTRRQNSKFKLVDALSSAIELKKIEVSSESDRLIDFQVNLEQTDITILGEKADFGKTISNLLNNSIEATGTTGKIEISGSRVGEFYVIEIKDSGQGFSDFILKNFKKRGVTQNKTHGNGIGLYNASQYFESLGGNLKIFNQLGAVVRISIPTS